MDQLYSTCDNSSKDQLKYATSTIKPKGACFKWKKYIYVNGKLEDPLTNLKTIRDLYLGLDLFIHVFCL
jgi:hypothetical protein